MSQLTQARSEDDMMFQYMNDMGRRGSFPILENGRVPSLMYPFGDRPESLPWSGPYCLPPSLGKELGMGYAMHLTMGMFSQNDCAGISKPPRDKSIHFCPI